MLVYSPKNPLRIPQAVATGVFGRESFNLGARSIVLGFVFHFCIALGAATVYYLASRKLTVLVRHAIPCGMIFGALVYLFMHFVVIPLSAVPAAIPDADLQGHPSSSIALVPGVGSTPIALYRSAATQR
jgi:uncharacterized membrane protein YagU involved in acid resistance